MANSLGTLNGSIVAQRALDILKEQYPALNLVTTDFSDAGADYGQTVVSRIITPASAGIYTTASGFNGTALTTTDVSVTINRFAYSTVEIFPTEYSATKRNLLDEAATKVATELGDDVYSQMAALYIGGNYSNSITQTVSGANRINTIVAANTALSKRKVSGKKFAIFNSDLYGQLWADESLVKATWGAGGIAENKLPEVHDTTLTQYTALPTTGNLIGVIGRKDAVVFASRLPTDVGSLFNGLPKTSLVFPETSEDLGLTIQMRVQETEKGSVKLTACLMYGVAVGNPAALQLIKSS